MAANEAEVRVKLRGFLNDNFLLGASNVEVSNNGSLLDLGIVDSTGVLEFVGYLKDEWSIDVADEELLPENFDSIDNLTRFVLKKLS